MKIIGSSLAAARILILLCSLVPDAAACTWASGYFHQMTQLRGTVVGVSNGDYRHPFSFLRQRAAVGQAKLTLYDYPLSTPLKDRNKIVKTVATDDNGTFDFGVLPEGHYTLLIVSTRGEDRFDVQIIHSPKLSAFVEIDVSPNYPDCTGGHEFIAM